MKKILVVVLCVVLAVAVVGCTPDVEISEESQAMIDNTHQEPEPFGISQEKTDVNIDEIEGYIEAPIEVYSTPASKNGLDGTLMYMDCTITRVLTYLDLCEEEGVDPGDNPYNDDLDVLFTENENGAFMFTRYGLKNADELAEKDSSFDVDGWAKCKQGQEIRIWFSYAGFSGVTQTGSGDFQYALPKGEALSELPIAININYGYNTNESYTISMEEFNKIHVGMDYDEVCKIIGSDGELQSQSSNIKIYAWDGDGSIGANASITFINDKVESKAQSGLK